MRMKEPTKEELLKQLLKAYNPGWETDPDMRETPQRYVRLLNHFFRNESPEKHLEKKFPTSNDQIIALKDISAIGMCPHHLMPIEYTVHIGYLPNGYALGLSKFTRLTRAVASVPKLQENMTSEIADLIEKHLSTRGVMVVVSGIHGCMKFRGVEEPCTSTITSEVRGRFAEDGAEHVKQEFLDLIKRQ